MNTQGNGHTLRQSSLGEDDYKSIINAAMDGFCILDVQGRIIYMNDAYCQRTGKTEELQRGA